MCRAHWAEGASVLGSGNSLCQGPVAGVPVKPLGSEQGEILRGFTRQLGLHPRSPGELWKGVQLVCGRISSVFRRVPLDALGECTGGGAGGRVGGGQSSQEAPASA